MTAITQFPPLSQLRQRASALDLDGLTAEERKSFLFFRANHYHLFGPSPEPEIRAAFRRYWTVKYRAALDFGDPLDELLDNQLIRGESKGLALARQRPVIFSGFHYGPYNLISLVLGRLGFQYSVLANGAVYMDIIRRRGQTHSDEPHAILDESDVIKPGSLASVLAIREKIRSGKHMLVFGDGLEGQTDYFDRSKLISVDFLDKKIYARRGVATIAYKLGVPIVPFITSREGERLCTEFFTALDPADFADRDSFVRAYCQEGYRNLEPFVREDPTEWEIFDHLQMYLPGDGMPPPPSPEPLLPATHLRFDQARFGCFEWRGKVRLLDREDRSVLGITPGLSDLLGKLCRPYPLAEVERVVPAGLLAELRARRVLLSTPS